MITWIQKTFQQHFRLVFLVVLVFTVAGFVWVFNPSSGMGRNQGNVVKRPFFGLDLGNDQDRARLMSDGSLSAILEFGGRLSETQIQQIAYQRATLLHLADQLGIPPATEAEIRAYVLSLPVFNQQGQFNATLYTSISQNPDVLSQATGTRVTTADFVRVLADNARISATSRLLAGPGYVLPADVQQALKRADTTWTLQTATIDRDSFKPAITPTDDEIAQAFKADPARYTIPARVRVTYAEIPSALFSGAITLSGTDVRAFYDANPGRFPQPANTAPATLAVTGTDADFALVRPQVETALRQQLATAAAYKAASDLSYKLYNDKILAGTPQFDALLKQNHATLNTAPDFSETDIPPALATTPAARASVAREAFALAADNPISNAIPSPNGAMILFWQETIPARQPALDEARDKVAADLIAQEKQKRFTALGQTLRAQIQAAVKTGAPFDQAVTDAAAKSGVTATTKDIAPFTMRQRPQDLPAFVFAALENLSQGDISDMATIDNTGLLVYVKTAQTPDLTAANPDYASAAQQIGYEYAGATASSYIQNLIDAELAKSGLTNTPQE